MTIFGKEANTMQALEDTIAVLGRPVFVRALDTRAKPAAAIARWRHGGGLVEVAPSSSIRLAMSLVPSRNAHERNRGATANRGSVTIFSPREGARVDVRGEADVVQLFLDETQAEAALGRKLACPPSYTSGDDRMRALIMRIAVGSARRGPDDALGVETDLQALALLIGHPSDMPLTLFRGGLAPAAFRRVEAMIEAALDEAGSPTLATMAKTAGLSITHFVRAFSRHTGSTPHKYLVRRRMERAVSLLRFPNRPIGEVADAVGFATPAHFVATFRAAMGVPPGAVRDALAG